MNEELDPEVTSQEVEVEDDPLAELARIVAGEAEQEPPSTDPDPVEPPVEVIETVDESPIEGEAFSEEEAVAVDEVMEDALQEELMREFADASEPVEEEVVGVENEVAAPDFVEEIRAAVGGVDGGQAHEELSAVEESSTGTSVGIDGFASTRIGFSR